jgi:hypothetical protein
VAPWATVSKVNAFAFSPGDTISFKAGEVWREALVPSVNGSALGHITFKSYSSGNKPKLVGSVKPGTWTSLGGNKWRSAANQCPFDVGNVILNGGALFGIKKANLADLTQQGHFWYDATNKEVVMYSTQNPGTFYTSMECALKRHIVNLTNRHYIKLEGLELVYGGAHGVSGTNCSHIVINGCSISYMGGSYLSGTVRYGNGIQFYNAAHDCTVTNNYIRQIYDTGITNQGDTAAGHQQYNLYYQNNTIDNCEWSFEIWSYSASSSMDSIYFENSLCRYAGDTWAHSQRPDPSGAHVQFFASQADATNIFIRYNTFNTSTGVMIAAQYSPYWNDIGNVVLDHNDYVQASGDFAQ